MKISAEVTVLCKNEECGQNYNEHLDGKPSLIGLRYLPPTRCGLCGSPYIHIIELRIEERR